MSYGDCFHEETMHIDGTDYYVTYSFDNDSSPPWQDGTGSTHSRHHLRVYETEGYGVLFEVDNTDFNPGDFDVEDYAQQYGLDLTNDADATEAMEMSSRMQAAVLLRERYDRRNPALYFDVWETQKIARKEGWGGSDHTPEEAVDRLYRWMQGWYNDDWHYIGIEVTNKSNGKRAALWGIESEDTNYHAEVIADLIVETNA